jgi:hypothetical protein
MTDLARSREERAVERDIFIVGTMRSGTGFLGLQLNKARGIIV